MSVTPPSIIQLSETVANRIAAGEVVERPASVVKELVENSIDAGASRIAVSIREGGLGQIQVTDDGCGVPAAEVAVAFERHATSKIRTSDDLFAIRTLGFRGEALPSIASVSVVVMRTKTREARMGTEIRVEGGRRTSLTPVGTPDGTTITVSRLFYNTPARRKFLKSESAERRAITELLTKLALAHPGIQFVFTAEEREVFRTPGDGELLSAVSALYGPSLARSFLPVEREAPFGRVSGAIAPPSETKGTRQHLSVYVNGRWVESRALSTAVERGYGNMLPARRFPVAVVQLAVDPTFVDVNVHPAKTEVRFRDERAVFSAVMHAVREALLSSNLITPTGASGSLPQPGVSEPPRLELFTKRKPMPVDEEPTVVWRKAPAAAPINTTDSDDDTCSVDDERESPRSAAEEVAAATATRWEVVDMTTGEVREVSPPRTPEHWHAPLRSHPVDRNLPPGPKDAEEAREWLRQATVLGQVLNTYMVVPVPWGLWLVDQHVAHERILYEKALGRYREGTSAQPLLVPLQVDLSVQALACLEEFGETLTQMGFEYEPFGGTSVLVRSVPTEFARRAHVVSEILEEMAELHSEGRMEERRHRVAAMVACKGAVKAGQRLDPEVMKGLLVRLADAENPFACPHGRPIVVEIGQAELERRFGRR